MRCRLTYRARRRSRELEMNGITILLPPSELSDIELSSGEQAVKVASIVSTNSAIIVLSYSYLLLIIIRLITWKSLHGYTLPTS